MKNLYKERKPTSKPFKFNCTECNSMFKENCALKRHMVVHTGEKPYECEDCGQRFTQNGTLLRHRRKRYNIQTLNLTN